MSRTTIKIPPASNIDYRNTDEICGYQTLICKIFEREGGFSYPSRMNATIHDVQTQSHIWLKEVKNIIDQILSGQTNTLTLAAIPRLLTAYDFSHRVGYDKPADDYLRNVRLKTVTRWAQGDKTIPETYLVLELLKEIYRDNKTLDRKYSIFALNILGDWITELKHHGELTGTPLTEAFAILSFLIDSDLVTYTGTKDQTTQKARWIKNYRQTDQTIDNFDPPTLMAYISFTRSAMIHQRKFNEAATTYLNLISRLASLHDTNPYLRQALRLDLETKTEPHPTKLHPPRPPHPHQLTPGDISFRAETNPFLRFKAPERKKVNPFN